MMATAVVFMSLILGQFAEGFTSPVVVSTTPKNVLSISQSPLTNSLARPTTATTTETATSSTKTSLNIYGMYGYDRGWNYDYGGGLAYGTDQYRQRYNDGYNGGVNLSYNGYSQQTNVARSRNRLGGGGYGYGGMFSFELGSVLFVFYSQKIG